MKQLTALCFAILLLAACNNTNKEQEQHTEDTIGVAVTDSSVNPTTVAGFTKEVNYKTFYFTVTSQQSNDTTGSFTLTPKGYAESNDSFVQEIKGKVVDLLIDELDGDDKPEVAVVTQYGTDSARKAYVYSSNNDKSVSQVNFAASDKYDVAMKDNNGRDEYNFVEGSFVHRFPLFNNGNPTGTWKQIQYKLKPGEAMKQLVAYKVVEF